jgi:hypothetical protein
MIGDERQKMITLESAIREAIADLERGVSRMTIISSLKSALDQLRCPVCGHHQHHDHCMRWDCPHRLPLAWATEEEEEIARDKEEHEK